MNENQITKVELIEMLRKELPVLRARLNISQEKIAEMIGIFRQTYNAIENEKRELTWSNFMSLLTVFQNNYQTSKMLGQLDGFEDKLKNI